MPGMDAVKWDGRYLDLAELVSSWSKDRSLKVGCVVVGNAGQVLATGYNGFPRGVDDDADGRHERPAKYAWTEHAERNAIYNAARDGVSLLGTTMYISWFPCADCARGIIQSGISSLVTMNRVMAADDRERWRESFGIAGLMLDESGVTVRWFPADDEASDERAEFLA